MVVNESRRVRSEQLAELSRTIKVGTHLVFVQGFAVTCGKKRRHELRLTCGRRTAVVDVGAGGVKEVEASLDRCVWAFVESLRVQKLL